MKLRITALTGALAAIGLFACSSNNGQSQTQQDRQNLAQTEQQAHQKVAQAEQNANQDVAQAKQNAAQNVQQARQQLAQDERNAQNQNDNNENNNGQNDNAPNRLASQSGTVVGTLTDVDKDSLTIQDSAGNSVNLKRSRNTKIRGTEGATARALRKGSEVRAAWRVDKSGDKWAETVTLEASPKANPMRQDKNDND